jgi:hypothetical protein
LRADGAARVAARQAQALTAAPPQIETPPEAEERCEIYILPLDPTLADLEVGYQTRGAQLMACDGRRGLAVSAHAREHELEAEWLRIREARGRWRWWPW